MSDIIKALDSNIIPWKTIEYRTTDYWMFDNDGKSSIFTPVTNNIHDMVACYKAAYSFGVIGIQQEKWATFHLHQTVGKDNNIDYPFVELIPVG